MKKLLLTLISTTTLSLSLAVAPLSSPQVGTSPFSGYILQTNGATSTWVSPSSLGGINYDYATSTFVPYVGATSDVNIGGNTFYASQLNAVNNEIQYGVFPNNLRTLHPMARNMYWQESADGYGVNWFWNLLTGDRNYTFPDNSGTIALTSDIPDTTNFTTYTYSSSTFPSFSYASSTFALSSTSGITSAYASSTFPSFNYASSTYGLVNSSNTWGGNQSFTNVSNFNSWTNNGNGTTTSLSLTGLTNTPLLSTNSVGKIVSATTPIIETLGGTNQSSYILGDTLYASASNTLSKLAGNTSSSTLYLSMTGDGVNAGTPSWQPLNIPGIAVYFQWGTQSTSSPAYFVMSPTATSTGATKSFAGLSGTTFLQNWITPVGTPGVTILPKGMYNEEIYAARTSGTMNVTLYAEIWEVSSTGVDIAKIATTNSTSNLTGVVTPYSVDFERGDYLMGSINSRLVVRIYAVTNGGGTAPTVQLSFGNGTDSNLTTPGATVDVTNFIPYTGATKNIDLGAFGLTTTGYLNATTSKFTNSSSTALTSTNLYSTNFYPSLTSSWLATDNTGKMVATTTFPVAVLSGGTNGYGVRWLSSSTVGTSTILDDGVNAGVNATSSLYEFFIKGDTIGSHSPFAVASSSGTIAFSVGQDNVTTIGTSTISGTLGVTGLTTLANASTTNLSASTGATLAALNIPGTSLFTGKITAGLASTTQISASTGIFAAALNVSGTSLHTGLASFGLASTTAVSATTFYGALVGNASTATNASTVTTNANLTGVITSSGNATSIASQTGTGSKFVVDTSPTLVTPILGVASSTALTISGALYGATGTFSSTLGVTGQTNLATASSTSLTVSGVSYLATTTIAGGATVTTGAIQATAYNWTTATSTTMTVDWKKANTQTINIGTSAITVTFVNGTTTPGSSLNLFVCNPPTGTPGAITWTQVYWANLTVPTATATNNNCDMYSFKAVNSTSTAIMIGNMSAKF